jgi:hypothetical protein
MINKIFIAAGMFFVMIAAVAQASVGDQFRTATPGHKYLDELTLRGPMTGGRKTMCQWINSVAKREEASNACKLQEVGFSQQIALFQLQRAVNRDSEQFQALTNIQKAKHDR